MTGPQQSKNDGCIREITSTLFIHLFIFCMYVATGSGKTIAFGMPLLMHLKEKGPAKRCDHGIFLRRFVLTSCWVRCFVSV